MSALQIVVDGYAVGYENTPEVVACAKEAASELAQLRTDLQAAQERIAWLTSDIGDDGLAAINRLIATCERGDIAQQAAPDLSIARDEILRQARQLNAARDIMISVKPHLPISGDGYNTLHSSRVAIDEWLAANPAPQETQP